MYGILASPYFYPIHANDILFIEDAATIEKNFAMLKDAGIFNHIKGIVLEKHALFNDIGSGRQPLEILQEVLQ
ncbi:hypothetical protein [Liquorilactobacillus oeni]|uniref:LD-carboxypeptidase C-terminal domain-containing protein n=1 Tax=Liquorilactobacillus oeni DSM 19972 TaxID=1423777 RepID=A0A0R1MCC5_9LACO|nr:hypothetical protein [Liquorilactobacillus oeni]KRL05885.1 hypothetical protein FD46_GL000645 [Liquorilactobacillus oeni DSM 19972]